MIEKDLGKGTNKCKFGEESTVLFFGYSAQNLF